MEDKSIPIEAAPAPTVAESGQKTKKRGAFTLFKSASFIMQHRSDRRNKTKPLQKAAADSNGAWKKIVGSIRPFHLHHHLSPPRTALRATVEPSEEIAPPSPNLSTESMSQYGSATNLQELEKESNDLNLPEKNLQHLQWPPSRVAPASVEHPLTQLSYSRSSESLSQYASATNLQELEMKSNNWNSPLQHRQSPSPSVSSALLSNSSSAENLSQYGSAANLQELEKGSNSRYASAVNLKELGLEEESGDDDEEDDESDDERENENGGDEMIDAKADEFIAQFYIQMKIQNSQSVNRHNGMTMEN